MSTFLEFVSIWMYIWMILLYKNKQELISVTWFQQFMDNYTQIRLQFPKYRFLMLF